MFLHQRSIDSSVSAAGVSVNFPVQSCHIQSQVSNRDSFSPASCSQVSSFSSGCLSVPFTSSVDFVMLHERVHASSQPNYVNCPLPVPSGLHIPCWHQYLSTYPDAQICAFLEYGWPIRYD